jgi:hypothetical protein
MVDDKPPSQKDIYVDIKVNEYNIDKTEERIEEFKNWWTDIHEKYGYISKVIGITILVFVFFTLYSSFLKTNLDDKRIMFMLVILMFLFITPCSYFGLL